MKTIKLSEETLMSLRDYDESAKFALARGLALRDRTAVIYSWSRDGFQVIPIAQEFRVTKYPNPII